MHDRATGHGHEMVYSGKTVKGKALYFETLDGLPLAIRLLRVPKHVAGRRHVSRIRPTFDSPGIVTDELGETVLDLRSEEHTSKLQSLMRISYAVFCLQKKNNNTKLQQT